MLTEADVLALVLSLQLALVSTVILLLLGAPLAWWLARSRRRGKAVIQAIVALPLVLPPTVIGFYLLLALGPHGPIGALCAGLGLPSPAFSFTGLVIGSVIYSLPFVVQPLQTAFGAIDDQQLEAAATLRAGPWDRLRSIVLPQTRAGILAAAVLAFAHTIGEFGVVLMIGGNIPGATRVVSIAIYDHVETLAYDRAHMLAGILLAFSFVLLLAVYGLGRRRLRVLP